MYQLSPRRECGVLRLTPALTIFHSISGVRFSEPIARHEKKGMDTWETVHFEIEVTEREVHLPNTMSILKMQLVYEPGKRARLA